MSSCGLGLPRRDHSSLLLPFPDRSAAKTARFRKFLAILY